MLRLKMTQAALAASFLLTVGTSPLAAGEPTAADLLAQTHAGRADWNGMPGFKCRVRVRAEGQAQEGTLVVSPEGKGTVTGIEFENDRATAGAIRSLVGHRFASDDDESVVSFADGETNHPLGRLIQFDSGSAKGAKFRIAGDTIYEVHRQMGEGRFTITVMDVYRTAEGKHLPQNYTVSYWDKDGALTGASMIHDEWTRVGKWDLPQSYTSVRTDAGGQQVVRIEFFDHDLLGK